MRPTAPAVSEDERELLAKARDYDALVKSPAWKHLLDFMALFADHALKTIRGSSSTDPYVVAGLFRQWKAREDSLQAIQNEVLGTIETRNDWIRDATGVFTADQLEQELERKEIEGR